MSKILRVLALAAVTGWPTTVLAASDREVPTRGMTQTQVHAQFGEPEQTRPAVGQPPISRWDYNGFSVYFENDTTLHTVREDDRAPKGKSAHSDTHSSAEAEAGQSPTNGEEPPTGVEEQESHIEVETYNRPADDDDQDDREDEESGTESDSAPGSTGVRADADGSKAAEGRFRFDPATGRIVVDDDAAKSEP